MTPKSLWGSLPLVDEIRTPTQVLKEQASALADLTGGALQGHVVVRAQGPNFDIDLDIVAPAISNYTYNVVNVTHGIDIYPVKLRRGWTGEVYSECPDEPAFESLLQQILSSDHVRRVISSLLAQSRATA